MNAHLSSEIVERFHNQSLSGGDRGVIYNHILACEACRRRVVTSETEAVSITLLTEHLLPQFDEDWYHLDSATTEAFVDDQLDTFDRNIAKLHLEDCAECSDEVTDLRESLATMRAASREEKPQHTAVIAPKRRYIFAMPMRVAAMVAVIAFAALALLVVLRWKSSGPTASQNSGSDKTAGSQPTPLASPQIPSFAPSPEVITPPNVAENPPSKDGNKPSPSAVIALKDGPNQVTIDETGNIAGLPALPTESRQAVKDALTGERLTRPNVLDELTTTDVSTRAPTGDDDRITIAYPIRRVIQSDRPTLRWKASKTAQAYRVEIADESFRRVAQSEDLSSASQSWTPSAPLKRGQVYTWTIRAVTKGGELSPLTSQGKFKVLGHDKERELNQLKARQSHLALGLFYAREGMIAEAEGEFGLLAKANPNSVLAKRLLRQVRSWWRAP
jgi:predicted anti-sigma-YlaC factor YlaD